MRLVLSAGEASGDQIAADLALALRQRHPGIELAGLAGPRMQAAGVTPWYGLDALNVMGLTEVISHLPRLVRLRREYRHRILAWQPDAFIGIDAPDFNLGLARQLRRRGLTTIHYVSPSVWAWRAHRIGKIARSLDLLLTLFPFEPELYRPHGLDARFVGHHLADSLSELEDRDSLRDKAGLQPGQPMIALLPGSRDGELQRHAALLGATAKALRARFPHAMLVMLLASKAHKARVLELAGRDLAEAQVTLVANSTRTGLRAADLAIAASGTVTLEAFLVGCPLVVYYRLPPATYWLARTLRLVRSRFVSLPNILSNRELVPERLQDQASAQQLAADAGAWLENPERIAAYRTEAGKWCRQLALGAGDRAASAILEKLDKARS
ncbi:MAG: lipid-A-disaccharide synthase [Wenzhouxiangella sp.]|nr:MAG: lipid-A-disaccharide synthase [Wenzhouxiangella sp.]